MTDLDASGSSPSAVAAAAAAAPASDPHNPNLNDISIPATSPLTNLFPSSSSPIDGDASIANTTADASAAPAPASTSTGPAVSATSASAPQSHDPSPRDAAEVAAAAVPTQEQPIVTTSTVAGAGTDAIAPATSTPTSPIGAAGETSTRDVPALVITLLLTSGARHPYKIDERYLTKRNVAIPGITEAGKKDPFSISVYTLKELILREWREEWETQPSSPSSIRLIYFGRLLDDKAVLKGTVTIFSSIPLFLISNPLPYPFYPPFSLPHIYDHLH